LNFVSKIRIYFIEVSLKGKLSELDKMIKEHEKANELRIFEEWKKSQTDLFNQFVNSKKYVK
jgi:hypothetical protein